MVADLVYEAIISKENRKFIVYGHSNFGPALHFLVHFEINFNLLSKIVLSKLICHCSDILYLMYCIYKMWSHVRLQLFRALAIKTRCKKEKSSRVLTDRETLFLCLWRVFNLESVKSVKTLEEISQICSHYDMSSGAGRTACNYELLNIYIFAYFPTVRQFLCYHGDFWLFYFLSSATLPCFTFTKSLSDIPCNSPTAPFPKICLWRQSLWTPAVFIVQRLWGGSW